MVEVENLACLRVMRFCYLSVLYVYAVLFFLLCVPFELLMCAVLSDLCNVTTYDKAQKCMPVIRKAKLSAKK
jgi:hypothetical protein